MAESFVNVTEGAGKKLHTFDSVVGANTVHDEFTLPGEFPHPTYVVSVDNISIATAADHVLQIMAGASLKVRILRIHIKQAANATTASLRNLEILRLTTAGTGGTAVTPAKHDTSDAAAGAAAMTLPTVKGTESTMLYEARLVLRQVNSATTAQVDDQWEWVQKLNQKPIVIQAGTTNGIAIKNITATPGATVTVTVEFREIA